MRVAILVTLLFVTGMAGAAQMDIHTFNNLRRGMHESEVLARAGEPDRITAPGGLVLRHGSYGDAVITGGARVEFHYVPEPREHDPWLTVVVLTHGRVSALERHKIMGRSAVAPEPSRQRTAQPAPPSSDDDIRRERAERTLRAAQRYADVRWRIQERAGAADADEGDAGSRPVFRGTDDAGAAYFGDVAPSGQR